MPGTESSLVLLERGAALIAQANTIQDAKELMDKFLTLKDWATRRKLGEQSVAAAQVYALKCERKMGEMLEATERAKGKQVNPTGHGGGPVVPTLSEIGLTKNASSKAQQLAAVPLETFNEVCSGTKSRAKAVRESSPAKKSRRRTKPAPSSKEETADGLKELAHAAEEAERDNERLRRENQNLTASDSGKVIATLNGKYEAVNGRVVQLLETESQMRATLKYQAGILEKCRKLLGIDSNAKIVPAIEQLVKEARHAAA